MARRSLPSSRKVGWEQRLGARAFVWVGAVTLALAGVFLVRYSIEEGYLSPEVRVILAALFGFALIGGAETHAQPRRSRRPGAGRRRRRLALRRAVLGGRALRHDLQGRGRRRRRGADRLRDRRVAAPRHLRRGASPSSAASRAPPSSAARRPTRRCCSATCWRSPPARWPSSACAAGGRSAGACWRASAMWTLLWMVVAGGRPALGRPVPGRRRRPVRLGDLAAVRRKREPDRRRRGAGLGGARRHRRPDRGPDRPGRRQAERRLAGAGGAWRRPLRARRAGRRASSMSPALAPVLSLAALVLWWADTRGAGPDWDSERFAWLAILLGGFYAAGAFALLWNAARPGFWAALVRRRRARALPALLVRAARRRRRHAVGPDQHRARRAVPGRRRAAGALARHHARRHRGAGLTARRASPSSSPSPSRSSSAANGSRWPMPSSSPPWPRSPRRLDLIAMRRLCWPLLAVVVVRFVLNPEVLKYPLGRHADLQLDPVGLRPLDRGLRGRDCASCGRPAMIRWCARPRRRSRCWPSCCSPSRCAASSAPTP